MTEITVKCSKRLVLARVNTLKWMIERITDIDMKTLSMVNETIDHVKEFI